MTLDGWQYVNHIILAIKLNPELAGNDMIDVNKIAEDILKAAIEEGVKDLVEDLKIHYAYEIKDELRPLIEKEVDARLKKILAEAGKEEEEDDDDYDEDDSEEDHHCGEEDYHSSYTSSDGLYHSESGNTYDLRRYPGSFFPQII